jgi:hypothetical protein
VAFRNGFLAGLGQNSRLAQALTIAMTPATFANARAPAAGAPGFVSNFGALGAAPLEAGKSFLLRRFGVSYFGGCRDEVGVAKAF